MLGLKIKPTKCEIFFLGDITEKRRSNFSNFTKTLPRDQNTKDGLIILGSPLDPNSQADLLEKKINELEKIGWAEIGRMNGIENQS